MYYLPIYSYACVEILEILHSQFIQISFFWKYVQAEHKFWDCIQGLSAINIKYSDGLIF